MNAVAITLILAASNFAKLEAQVTTKNRLEISGPSETWMRREVRIQSDKRIIFVPSAEINEVQRKLNGRTVRTRSVKRGAVITISPSEAPGEVVRFIGKVVPPEPSPIERVEAQRPVADQEPPSLPSVKALVKEPTPGRWWPIPLAIVGFAGLGLLLLRNRKSGQLSDDSINIVAVRPLGPKHRLLVVDTGGERLLLSATATEVRLLANLGRSPASSDEGGASLDESSDLAGLFRLRSNLGQDEDSFTSVFNNAERQEFLA